MTFLVLSTELARRIHISRPGTNRPVCGGGRNGKSRLAWQSDTGPANCQRCIQILVNLGLKSLK
jgi:hypothetical protein